MPQWTVTETQYILSNPHKTIRELSKDLNRSQSSIKHYIARNGLKAKAERSEWTEEELEILKTENLYLKQKIHLLSRHTPMSIRAKYKTLGLTDKKIVKEKIYQDRKFIRDENNKLVPEHRLLMQRHVGRKLDKKEQIHHINCDSLDNSISNLYLCKNFSEHNRIHWSLNSLIKSLMKANLITFDREEGIYKLVK